ncbi:redoxin domain-containing protein [Iodobacter sp. HSC-16F04]|uniref:Redoxin domain-containing protein n=1 Tax=Iodobacter violaceini TaxID=3044271 RepID=A0ABX0KUN1_9NEIS|nr:redoxin domain-containing protein [Iodobacter violacea]NHQ88376.1 redoxin domain-containing protein [Iodobacter violacea]
MNSSICLAPALQTSQWLNSDQPVVLNDLLGKVVLIYVFQMLCPACVSHGLPQARAIRGAFVKSDVVVLGLHSVFEHHSVMGAEALRVFLHEYRIGFPVGIDQASLQGPIPQTMQYYGLQGTPSLILIDRQGQLRLQHFGHLDDLRLGAKLGGLLAEAVVDPVANTPEGACDANGCRIA